MSCLSPVRAPVSAAFFNMHSRDCGSPSSACAIQSLHTRVVRAAADSLDDSRSVLEARKNQASYWIERFHPHRVDLNERIQGVREFFSLFSRSFDALDFASNEEMAELLSLLPQLARYINTREVWHLCHGCTKKEGHSLPREEGNGLLKMLVLRTAEIFLAQDAFEDALQMVNWASKNYLHPDHERAEFKDCDFEEKFLLLQAHLLMVTERDDELWELVNALIFKERTGGKGLAFWCRCAEKKELPQQEIKRQLLERRPTLSSENLTPRYLAALEGWIKLAAPYLQQLELVASAYPVAQKIIHPSSNNPQVHLGLMQMSLTMATLWVQRKENRLANGWITAAEKLAWPDEALGAAHLFVMHQIYRFRALLDIRHGYAGWAMQLLDNLSADAPHFLSLKMHVYGELFFAPTKKRAFQQAIQKCQHWLMDGRNAAHSKDQGLFLLALLHLGEGKKELAVRLSQTLAEGAPLSSFSKLLKAILALSEGERETAQEELQAALQCNEELGDVYFLLAGLHDSSGDEAALMHLKRRFLSAPPTGGLCWFNYLMAYQSTNHLSLEQLWDEMLSIHRQSPAGKMAWAPYFLLPFFNQGRELLPPQEFFTYLVLHDLNKHAP